MKNIILIFALALAFTNSCFSQNALYLKNGDKMSGKLEGYTNDTILFNFQGNKLKFNTADIESVYFNEKEISAEPAKAAIPADINPSQMGKITGVITYLTRFEFQPDAGTNVYFADSAIVKGFNLATLDSFNNFIVYKYYKKTWKPRPTNLLLAAIYDAGEKYNYDKESFNLLDKRVAVNISKILDARNITKTVVDGSGNYSANVKPGIYYVLFKSRNSTRIDKVENPEPFKCFKVNINEGEDVKMSYAFGFEFK